LFFIWFGSRADGLFVKGQRCAVGCEWLELVPSDLRRFDGNRAGWWRWQRGCRAERHERRQFSEDGRRIVDDIGWFLDDGRWIDGQRRRFSEDVWWIDDDARRLVVDGRWFADERRRLSEDSWRIVDDGWRLLDDSWRFVDDSWRIVDDGWRLLDDVWRIVDDGWHFRCGRSHIDEQRRRSRRRFVG
jgi:hypothetical protein